MIDHRLPWSTVDPHRQPVTAQPASMSSNSPACGRERVLRIQKRRGRTRAWKPQRSSFLLYFLLYIFIFEEFVEPVFAGRNFYETLGVGRDADSATIKKAYRRLTLKYHPGAFFHAFFFPSADTHTHRHVLSSKANLVPPPRAQTRTRATKRRKRCTSNSTTRTKS